MATLAAGSSTNSFLGYGQTVTLTVTHNVSGRYYYVPQNASLNDINGTGHQFGPLPMSLTLGPFAGPGTLYLENYTGSAAVVTYTINNGTAYPGNFSSVASSGSIAGPVAATTLSASGAVSGTGFSNYLAAPPAIGGTTPAAVKTSNLQATYTDSSGTPGNVTNNSPRGRAAFAAAGASVTVTNSLVAATSSVLVQLGGADATATSVRVTAAAGSFTVTANAAATGATPFDFLVVN